MAVPRHFLAMQFGALEMQRCWRGARVRLLLCAGRHLAIRMRLPVRGALRRLELKGGRYEAVTFEVAREVEASVRAAIPTPSRRVSPYHPPL